MPANHLSEPLFTEKSIINNNDENEIEYRQKNYNGHLHHSHYNSHQHHRSSSHDSLIELGGSIRGDGMSLDRNANQVERASKKVYVTTFVIQLFI